jgi:hypothetical protein
MTEDDPPMAVGASEALVGGMECVESICISDPGPACMAAGKPEGKSKPGAEFDPAPIGGPELTGGMPLLISLADIAGGGLKAGGASTASIPGGPKPSQVTRPLKNSKASMILAIRDLRVWHAQRARTRPSKRQ